MNKKRKVIRIVFAFVLFICVTASIICGGASMFYVSYYGYPNSDTENLNLYETEYAGNMFYNETFDFFLYLESAEENRELINANDTPEINYYNYNSENNNMIDESNQGVLNLYERATELKLNNADFNYSYENYGVTLYGASAENNYIRIKAEDLKNLIIKNKNYLNDYSIYEGETVNTINVENNGISTDINSLELTDIYTYIDDNIGKYIGYSNYEDSFGGSNMSDVYYGISDYYDEPTKYFYAEISPDDVEISEEDILQANIYTEKELFMSLYPENTIYQCAKIKMNHNACINYRIYWGTDVADTSKLLYNNVDNMDIINESYYMNIFTANNSYSVYDKDSIKPENYKYTYEHAMEEVGDKNLIIYISLDKDVIYDIYSIQMANYLLGLHDYIYIMIMCAIIAATIAIILYLALVIYSGKDEDECTQIENFVDKVYLEAWMGIIMLVTLFYIFIIDVIGENINYEWLEKSYNSIGIKGIGVIIFIAYVLLYYLIHQFIFTVIRRLKKRELISSILIFKLVDLILKAIKNILILFFNKIPQMTKQKDYSVCNVLIFLSYIAVNFILIINIVIMVDTSALGFSWILLLAFNIFAIYFNIKRNNKLRRIQEGAKQISQGELLFKINTKDMDKYEIEFTETINNIGDGLKKAVDESLKAEQKSMKDERLKAELITNVSHDIKTPLTSIINYVDLLKRTDIIDENALHYIDILDKKSQRLKMLTEDLVEASKITTGNIELIRQPLDFKELTKQALGEFEDKFSKKKLSACVNLMGDDAIIYADGRRTFRVIDNLLQNVYKYSMPGTRIYIDMSKNDDEIILSIKNVSEQPLNIDVNELKERFTRGDESRNSEGSGLGLSIADSLMKLHGGRLELSIDGDLFRACVVFDKSNMKIQTTDVVPDNTAILETNLISEKPEKISDIEIIDNRYNLKNTTKVESDKIKLIDDYKNELLVQNKSVITKAVEYAYKAHEGAFRKGTDIPYIVHPLETGAITAKLTTKPNVIAAAILHDTVEDTNTTIEDIASAFGTDIAVLVDTESEDKSKSWKERKEHTVYSLDSKNFDEKILVLADKLSNMRDIYNDYMLLGDELWNRFNNNDKNDHAWYYKSIADKLDELCDYPEYKEFVELINKVFE